MLPLDRPDSVPASGPAIWVRRLKANEEVSVGICSPAIWKFWVHWSGDRSEPCYKDHKKCPGHKRGLPRRWKGFLYVVNERKRRCEFLEITLGAANQLLGQVGDSESFRGRRFRCTRGNGKAAGLTFSRQPDWTEFTQSPLPEDKDPLPVLAKLWGLDDLSDNQAIPTGIVLDG